MTKHEEAKKKIKDWLRHNPGATVTQAFKACKVKPTNFYYRPKASTKAAEAASKVAYQKVDGAKPAAAPASSPAAFPPHDGKLFMIVGTAQQIREMLK